MAVIAKVVPAEEKEAFSCQIADCIAMKPNIFTHFARTLLHKNHPGDWWKVVNPSFAELRKVVIRLLSQPCSASAYERNWSAFEAAHTKKRNKLEPKMLHDLVYVRVNLYLKKIKEKEEEKSDLIYLVNYVAFLELHPPIPAAAAPLPPANEEVLIVDDEDDDDDNDGGMDYVDIAHDHRVLDDLMIDP